MYVEGGGRAASGLCMHEGGGGDLKMYVEGGAEGESVVNTHTHAHAHCFACVHMPCSNNKIPKPRNALLEQQEPCDLDSP